jgi:hypothetical protein
MFLQQLSLISDCIIRKIKSIKRLGEELFQKMHHSNFCTKRSNCQFWDAACLEQFWVLKLRILHTNAKIIMLCKCFLKTNCGLSPWAKYSDQVKLVPTFADRGCHIVSMTDPYGRNLGFLDRSRHFFLA